MTRSGRLPGRVVALLAVALVAVGSPAVQGTPATAGPAGQDEQQVAVATADGGIEAREVSDDELARLQARGPGAVVVRGQTVAPQLAQATAKVGAPIQWATGNRGAGRVIVVIDTGVHTAFGGTLVGQACFAATQTEQGLDGHCGPGHDKLEAFDATCFDLGVCTSGAPYAAAGQPCGPTKSCAHGTAVATVAAGDGNPPGTAPDAGVYAIRVFNPAGSSADFVDILLALDHVVALADAGMDIAAVNLSLSASATYPSHCDIGSDPDDEPVMFRSVFNALAARGIASTVASGNTFATGGIGFPACVSNAIAVGASDLHDDMADFGNRGPTLELVAPGADDGTGSINPMDIPGNPVTDQWSGTSFAAPQVAGAFALIQEEYPKASVAQLTSLLRAAAASAHDRANGKTYRRLDLADLDRGLAARHLFMGSAGVTGSDRTGVGDLDGDGRSDVVVHGPGSGPDAVSYGRTTWGFDRRSSTLSGDLHPLVGQLRGPSSGPEDVLWYAPGSAADLLWIGQASRVPQAAAVSVSGVYNPALGDFDGDGWDDVLWYAPGGTADPIWFGGSAGFTTGAPLDIRGTYVPRIGDFDGDSRDDLLLYGPSSTHSIWYGLAARSFAKTTISTPGGRRVALGDANGDDRSDIVLHGPGPASDRLLLGAANRQPVTVTMTVNGSYQPVLLDVDRDGQDDVVWYAAGPSPDAVWTDFADGTPAGRHTTSLTGTYQPMVGDFDGDGWDDLVWSNPATAATPVWWSYVPPGG